jgi:aquaporin Z
MAYCVGNISGGHFNAAVTLAMLMRKKISTKDAVNYWIYQIAGAFIGSGLLALIFGMSGKKDMTGGLGSNGLAGVNGNAFAGFLVELVLTFIFLMTIQGVTSEKFKHGSFGGLIIGLTLTFVHIFGIGLTGTSVNPSRSIAPAVIAAMQGNGAPLGELWVFIAGPLAGAALAAIVYPALEKK